MTLTRWLATVLIALAAGFAGAALWSFSGLGGSATRDYLLANPQVLPEAMEQLQQRDMLARIDPLRDEIEQPFPGAVLGNPRGSVTLVEFTDYACGYCRHSAEDVEALIAADPDLRVVIREYPILSPESADAARMALAAAEQGKYAAFHRAMFGQGEVNAATIQAAARAAGLDLATASRAVESGRYEGQLQNNVFLAQSLGITGTPSWIVGDRALNGAIGREALGEAIADARDSA